MVRESAADRSFGCLAASRIAFVSFYLVRCGRERDRASLETGAKREAYEELGVEIELTQYLVRTKAVFTHGNVTIPWETHVFAAGTEAVELDPVDTHEISAARWGTLEELSGPIRKRLLATGRALWRYRVALHDAAGEALSS